jgi:hypothetical protein
MEFLLAAVWLLAAAVHMSRIRLIETWLYCTY